MPSFLIGLISFIAIYLLFDWFWNVPRINKAADFWINAVDAVVFCHDCLGDDHEEFFTMHEEVYLTPTSVQMKMAVKALRWGRDPRMLLSETSRKWYDRYMVHKALQRGEVKA